MARQATALRSQRLPEVLNLVRVANPTLYRQMEAGTFPKQVSEGRKIVVWMVSAVAAWMSAELS